MWIFKWLSYRLAEASTWAGISAFTYSLSGMFPQYAPICQAIGSVAAALAVGLKGGSGEYKDALQQAERAVRTAEAEALQRRTMKAGGL